MKVIVPVAGVGSRLRPHTHSTPKVLLHVAGRPILWHVLRPIVDLNPEEVLFVIGHKGDEIRSYVENTFSFKSTFVTQDQLLGLGYALGLAMTQTTDGPLLVVLGDTIVDCNLSQFVNAGEYVLGLREVEDPHRFGIAELVDGMVVNLEEKPTNPKTNLAVIGLYYFSDSRLLRDSLKSHLASGKTTKGEIQFTDALQDMIVKGTKFLPFQVDDWYDCGKKETMLSTNRHLLESEPEPNAIDGSTLIPPVFVGPGAVIHHSVIGPYVSVSEGAVIDSSIIRNSIIGPDARVRKAMLEDSLVGPSARVEGAITTLNIGDSSELSFS